jgi:hypothetical protein
MFSSFKILIQFRIIKLLYYFKFLFGESAQLQRHCMTELSGYKFPPHLTLLLMLCINTKDLFVLLWHLLNQPQRLKGGGQNVEFRFVKIISKNGRFGTFKYLPKCQILVNLASLVREG